MQRNIEILAPAGSFESAIAAINCGADAIYLGSRDFNARKNADNFSESEFEEIVAYAHECGVKVYQTLNTVLYDDELEKLLDTLEISCKVGVDALIVQDLAVYEIVKKCCPNMPLHASTQMSVHTPKGAQILKDMGFERVVLAREMSEREISEITDSCDVQTEVFVHGALCMCVSGQCYLSAMIGQRSGNRGLCAQPCRLPFSASDEKGRYDLSLKDLSLINEVEKFKEMGVTSLKIEGRMKRPEYVAAAVTALRQAVDFGKVEKEISQNLSNVFSRSGFTSGYFEGKLGPQMFGTRSYEDVLAADQKTFKSLQSLYQKRRKCVGVSFKLSLFENGEAVLFATDGESEVFAKTDKAFKADNLFCDKNSAEKNLSKMGYTPYYLKELSVENDFGMMLPISSLNALRREALELISKKRKVAKSVSFKRCDLAEIKKRQRRSTKVFVRVVDSSFIPLQKEQYIDGVILPIEKITQKEINLFGEKLIAELQRVKFSREDKVLSKLVLLKEKGVKKALISNIGDILLCKEAGVTPIGSFGLNVNNSVCMSAYKNLGVQALTLSPELTFNKIKSISDDVSAGIVAYGFLPLMVTRNCPAKNTLSCEKCKKSSRYLTDRRGVKFPVVCESGYSEVLNSAPIYLADKAEDLECLDFITLYFTVESKNEVSEVIDEYLKSHSKREGITRGLYYRGSF